MQIPPLVAVCGHRVNDLNDVINLSEGLRSMEGTVQALLNAFCPTPRNLQLLHVLSPMRCIALGSRPPWRPWWSLAVGPF